MTLAGFPHSEICGSLAICASPQLIAAYHVLHRLLTPRHPPFALSSLTEYSDARWLSVLPVVRIQLSKIRIQRTGITGADDFFSIVPSSGRTNAAHYDPSLVEIAGIEPATSGLQSRRSPN